MEPANEDAGGLPVTITIGDHTARAGTLDLDPTAPVAPQIAEALRAIADAIEEDDDDDTP